MKRTWIEWGGYTLKRSDDVAGTAVPLVSVCLPVYNGAATVGETISSLLSQSYPNFEIVVSDNASTDGTREVVSAFGDTRIRYRRNDTNVGAFPNWNLAIRATRGEYVAVYHADDVYHPDILSAESEFMEAYPGAGAVFAMDEWIDDRGRRIGGSRLPPELAGRYLYGFCEVFESLLLHGNNFLRCPTFMTRRTVFDRVGYFDERLEPFRSARDLDFFLRLLREFPIGIIDRKLVRYRISQRQGTADTVYLRTGDSDHHRVMDQFLSLAGGPVVFPKQATDAYEFSRNVDELFRATNCIVRGDITGGTSLLRKAREGILGMAVSSVSRWAYVAYAWSLSLVLALGLAPKARGVLLRILAVRFRYY